MLVKESMLTGKMLLWCWQKCESLVGQKVLTGMIRQKGACGPWHGGD